MGIARVLPRDSARGRRGAYGTEKIGTGLARGLTRADGVIPFVKVRGDVVERGDRGRAMLDGDGACAGLAEGVQAPEEVLHPGMLEQVEEFDGADMEDVGEVGETGATIEIALDEHLVLVRREWTGRGGILGGRRPGRGVG